MSHTEHPLVTTDGPDAASNLIRQRLESEPVVSGSKSTGDGVAGALGLLHGKETVYSFFESPVEQVLETAERNEGSGRLGRQSLGDQPLRQMEAVDGIEEKQGAHAVIQVVARSAEGVEFLAMAEQPCDRSPAANLVQGAIACGWIGSGDDADELSHNLTGVRGGRAIQAFR